MPTLLDQQINPWKDVHETPSDIHTFTVNTVMGAHTADMGMKDRNISQLGAKYFTCGEDGHEMEKCSGHIICRSK